MESLDFNLLRNKYGKDLENYPEEVESQIKRFDALYDVVLLENLVNKENTISLPEDFIELLDFASFIFRRKPELCENFDKKVSELISNFDLLMKLPQEQSSRIVRSSFILHYQKYLDSAQFFASLVKLFLLPDKALRRNITSHILKSTSILYNKDSVNNKANSQLFRVFADFLQHESAVVVKKVIGVMAQLYATDGGKKRGGNGVWKTAKTANVICQCVFSPHPSAVRKTMRFMLQETVSDGREKMDKEELDDSRKKSVKFDRGVKGRRGVVKKRKNERLKKKIKKMENVNAEIDGEKVDFSVIRSLYDPYSFVEKLFKNLRNSRENFETKILMMKVISRVISCHELIVVNFYSFLQRYMQPHQRNVTKILVFLVQACHGKVPPEALIHCIKSLAFNFVNDKSNAQIIAVGLNTIREICARIPNVIEEGLLQDLIQYKESKEKAVSVAARGLIGLFREIEPSLLPKKDRGKPMADNKDNKSLEDEEKEKITPEDPVAESEIRGSVYQKKEKIKENIEKKKHKYTGTKTKGGTTNEDKNRKKNFKLTKHRGQVKLRNQQSLMTKRKVSHEHKKRMKLGLRRKYKKKMR